MDSGRASLIVALGVWVTWPFVLFEKSSKIHSIYVLSCNDLSTNPLVLYPLFCKCLIHLAFVVIAFWTEPLFPWRVLKKWKLSGSRARRGPMSGELSAAMSWWAQRKLDKGLIFHLTAGEHVRKNNMSIVVICDWWTMQRGIRNTTPATLPAMSSNGRKALTLIWYPIRFKSTGWDKALNPWLLKPFLGDVYTGFKD